MVKHYNPTIAEDANRLFNFKQGEVVSTEVAPFIQPTVLVQRKCNIVKLNGVTNGTTATVYTTPSDKDFYVTAATLTYMRDATSDTTFIQMRWTIDGVVQTPLNFRILASTASYESISISLPVPVKVDRNTNITVNSGTATANITYSGTVIGYTVDTTKGFS